MSGGKVSVVPLMVIVRCAGAQMFDDLRDGQPDAGLDRV
jgi:hypothetical protein